MHIPVILLLTSIFVSSQKEFDTLQQRIEKELSTHPAELTINLAPGHYRFSDGHIHLYGQNCPETALSFMGEGAIVEGVASDIKKTDFFQLSRPVDVVDADRKLCRIRTKKRLYGKGKPYVQITSWFTMYTAPVTEIKGGYIYFTVENLARNGLGYNINGDMSYGKSKPRCRLLLVQDPSVQVTAFLQLTACTFRNVSLAGITFERNTGGRTEYGKDCLIRFYRNTLENAFISNCTFRSLESDVIQIIFTDGVEIRNCRFEDCSRKGIFSYNPSARTKVVGCFFERMGLSGDNDPCVCCRGTDYLISGNCFVDFGNCAIQVGVHYTEEMTHPSIGLIEHNQIYQTDAYRKQGAKSLLMDTGAIYVTTQNTSLEIRNNWVHDISGPFDNRGIFLDDGSINVSVHDNLVYNIANSYCIDARRVRWVETHEKTKISRVNLNNYIGGNTVDGRVRFETRGGNDGCRKGKNTVLKSDSDREKAIGRWRESQ